MGVKMGREGKVKEVLTFRLGHYVGDGALC